MPFEDPAGQRSTVDVDDKNAVPLPRVVPEPDLFPNLTAEAVLQMMEQRALDPYGVVSNLVRGDEEDRHAQRARGDEEGLGLEAIGKTFFPIAYRL